MVIGRKKKALVHIAKEELHLDEKSYRQILKSVAGVESATQLDREGFKKVMARFEAMGFKGLLPHPSQPVPKGQFLPKGNPQGEDAITQSQKDFIRYLLEALGWSPEHFHGFCNRIIKRPDPMTKRDGQKVIIGLMAILRRQALQRRRRAS